MKELNEQLLGKYAQAKEITGVRSATSGIIVAAYLDKSYTLRVVISPWGEETCVTLAISQVSVSNAKDEQTA